MTRSSLVRVVQTPHDGLVVCRDHLHEIAEGSIIAHEEIHAAQVSFWAYRCTMCLFDAVSGRLCENESCRKPLHPRWPAVYCCNGCALEDL